MTLGGRGVQECFEWSTSGCVKVELVAYLVWSSWTMVVVGNGGRERERDDVMD